MSNVLMDNVFFHLYKKVIDERNNSCANPRANHCANPRANPRANHHNGHCDRTILCTDNVGFSWHTKKNASHYIVKNMSLSIRHNEIISILGNTGVGKSTLAHIFSGRIPPSEGAVFVEEQAYEYGNKQSFYIQRAGIQLMPQIPSTSFHPFFSMERSLKDAFFIFKHSVIQAYNSLSLDTMAPDLLAPDASAFFNHIFEKKPHNRYGRKQELDIMHLFYACIQSLCLTFDMPLAFLKKTSSELSGGQLQRFALIRALLVFPHLLILDEPVSHLDISIRKSTLDTILMLYNSTDISLVLISHLEEVHNYFRQHATTTQYELKNQCLENQCLKMNGEMG